MPAQSIDFSEDGQTVRFTAGHGLDITLPVAAVLEALDEDGVIIVTDSNGLYADFEIDVDEELGDDKT